MTIETGSQHPPQEPESDDLLALEQPRRFNLSLLAEMAREQIECGGQIRFYKMSCNGRLNQRIVDPRKARESEEYEIGELALKYARLMRASDEVIFFPPEE